jgi:hypothetical protein
MFEILFKGLRSLSDSIETLIAEVGSLLTPSTNGTSITPFSGIFPSDEGESGFGFPGLPGLPGRDGVGIPGAAGDDGDVAFGVIGLPSVSGGEVTFTTTGNIDDLDFGNASIIRMNNASLATIRGLRSGAPGQRVLIINTNAQVNLAHQNAGSVAQNRLINIATSASTPLSTGGSAEFEYDVTSQRWRLVAHVQGAALTATFAAGDFTADSTTVWTVQAGDVINLSYTLKENLLLVTFTLYTTSIATPAAGGLLRMSNNQYGGFVWNATVITLLGQLIDNGDVSAMGYAQAGATVSNLAFGISGTLGAAGAYTTFTASTNNTYIIGSILAPVQ